MGVRVGLGLERASAIITKAKRWSLDRRGKDKRDQQRNKNKPVKKEMLPLMQLRDNSG